MLLGAGDGTFQPLGGYDTEGLQPLFGVLADLNGDGKIDLAAANECADSNCTSGSIIALLGNGKGGFGGPVSYSLGSSQGVPVSATADFNRDGKPDLALATFARHGLHPGAVSVLLSDTNGGFRPAVTYDPGGFSHLGGREGSQRRW